MLSTLAIEEIALYPIPLLVYVSFTENKMFFFLKKHAIIKVE